jgi:hypothetical protein
MDTKGGVFLRVHAWYRSLVFVLFDGLQQELEEMKTSPGAPQPRLQPRFVTHARRSGTHQQPCHGIPHRRKTHELPARPASAHQREQVKSATHALHEVPIVYAHVRRRRRQSACLA